MQRPPKLACEFHPESIVEVRSLGRHLKQSLSSPSVEHIKPLISLLLDICSSFPVGQNCLNSYLGHPCVVKCISMVHTYSAYSKLMGVSRLSTDLKSHSGTERWQESSAAGADAVRDRGVQ